MWSYLAIGLSIYLSLVAVLYLKDIDSVRKRVTVGLSCVVIIMVMLGYLVIDALGGYAFPVIGLFFMVCFVFWITDESESKSGVANVSINYKAKGKSAGSDGSGTSSFSPCSPSSSSSSFCGGSMFGSDSDD